MPASPSPGRRAREDYHDPTARLGGAPPARSALALRLVLAIFGVLFCAGAAIAAIVTGAPRAFAGVMAGLALIAIVDVAAILRRYRLGPR